jgi:hypothetical protein
MNQVRRRNLLVLLLAAAVVMFSAGTAAAVSGGGYSPDQQDCSWNAASNSAPSDPNATQPGCHNVAVNIENGGTTDGNASSNNTRYAEFGNDQSPNMDHNPSFGGLLSLGDPGTYDGIHSGCAAANTDGTGGGTGTGCGNNANGAGFSATYDYYEIYCPATATLPLDSVPSFNGIPALKNCAADQPVGNTTVTPDTGSATTLDDALTQGLLVYFGMDDNTDNGEHDGVSGDPSTDGVINGASDGGGMSLSVTPQGATNTPTGHNPEGAANYSMGFCADGICAAATTQQQTVYYGCGATNPQMNAADDQCAPGTPSSGNVYENGAPSSTQESPDCSSGSANDPACFTNVDGTPNPGGQNGYRQGTPNNMNAQPGVQTYQDPDPQRSPAAPIGTPGLYAGTCGVYANDGGGSVGPGITGQNPGYVVPGAC